MVNNNGTVQQLKYDVSAESFHGSNVLVPGLEPAAFATYSPQSLLAVGFSEQMVADTNLLLSTQVTVGAQHRLHRVVCIDTDTLFLRAIDQLALIRDYGYTTPYIWANYLLIGNWL